MTETAGASRNKKFPALIIVLITLLLAGFVLWRLDHAPRTDDAYIYADTVNVVPEVDGRIVELPVRDNDAVRQGDLLLRIDPRRYQDALNQALGRLDVLDKQIALTQRTVNAQQYNAASVSAGVERARAAANQATDTLRRTEPLLSQGYTSAEEVDRARTAQRAAQAELDAAMLQAQQAAAAVSGVDALVAQRAEVEAQIAIAKLNLEFTEVRAPFDGRVVSLRTTVGQFASALKPVFTLIDTRHWYVVANFRETELKNIHAGSPATVYLMSDTSRRFAGTVDSVGYGVLPDDGGVVLEGLPRVQRSINWVHVSQRFPVKIAVRNPDPALFRVGTSAVASLDQGGTRETVR
ncbi:Multidrug resistance protein MdtN [Paraburkholderia ultramafica]|uniref:Multidrug resistance protein MdtN n=1 Tax=Paraburkholderia ultramafica TaxID=1544867 RepID=A0A6S7BNL5_9BURK|nr:multidrug transporter subunit MdtN [Paraburkholderia ultramafica]CAB3807483.1 Multidrug resistance protein MdtN [Paraburkholderia ultramafica]